MERRLRDSIAAFFALGHLQKAQADYLKEKEMDQREKVKYKLYKALSKNGVPDDDQKMREIYQEYTLRESELTTAYGVGNCEPMADFALLNTIETMQDNYEINYIRFPKTEEYDEMNTIALGDWPNKGCIIISPWLGESGEFFTWQGNVETTKEVSHYPSVKVIFTIKPGQEMDEWKKILKATDFSKNAIETNDIKEKIKQQATTYREIINAPLVSDETNSPNTPRPNR